VGTRTGQRLLTPAYASPEQLAGGAVAPTTDVWALGVILHQLLTGRHPFERADRRAADVERAILEDEPTAPSAAVSGPGTGGAAALRDDTPAAGTSGAARTPPAFTPRALTPRALARALRGDLDAIVLRALARDPSARYPDAAALADDVRRHLAGAAVRARRDARGWALYRFRRLVGRHRMAVAAAALGMAAGVGALVAWRGEGALRDELHPVRGAARHAGTTSLRALGHYEDGLRAHGRGNWAEAARQLRQAVTEDSTFALAALFAADAASRDEDHATARAELARARRAAGAAPTTVGLLVRTYVAFREQSPTLAVTRRLARARRAGERGRPVLRRARGAGRGRSRGRGAALRRARGRAGARRPRGWRPAGRARRPSARCTPG
jgi:hypothetical protein